MYRTTLPPCVHTGCSCHWWCGIHVTRMHIFYSQGSWASLLLPHPVTSPPLAHALPRVVDCLISLLVLMSYPGDSLIGGWNLITSSCSYPQSLLIQQKSRKNTLSTLAALESVVHDLDPLQVQPGSASHTSSPAREEAFLKFSIIVSACCSGFSYSGGICESQFMFCPGLREV